MNKLDETLNTHEGWTIALNTHLGRVEIQMLDDAKRFSGDREAFMFVVAKMLADESKRHARALKEVSNDYILDMLKDVEEYGALPIIGFRDDLLDD